MVFRHIHEGQIRVKVYHGSSRESVANQFYDTDVIVTTYETLRTEWTAQEGARPLFSWKWLRVVLDEGTQTPPQYGRLFLFWLISLQLTIFGIV